MRPTRNQGWKKMNLRLDESLRQKLTEAAEREVRSVNGEIIARLRRSFPEESGAPQSAARDHGEAGA